MTLDTLEYMKRLEAAGVDRKQAEAHANAVRDTLATQVATEASLRSVADQFDNRLSAVADQFDNRLRAVADRLDNRISAVASDVADIKTRLRVVETNEAVLRWMVTTNIALSLVILGKLLLQ